MRNSGMMNSTDVQRRIGLVDNLEQQVNIGGPNAAMAGSGGRDADLLGISHRPVGGGHVSLATQALRHQDEMIDELAMGVSRLKDQTMMVNDEANMQNHMLDEMDGDVENARHGLEAETLRALKLKEDQSVW
eukprot:CAMPEP_0197735822 /NCGR_PEP_ID=MMETSP1435-20131217/1140_1 /TAXON_ID=426625 /ORGANISM="Chaetoceros brevis, Strain CCMP164" /LENGTH=131 /DNA_ID=CAMNT_0043323725 /DNA_START=61 /DNA_END=453 /DNA_ORIENTATION=+